MRSEVGRLANTARRRAFVSPRRQQRHERLRSRPEHEAALSTGARGAGCSRRHGKQPRPPDPHPPSSLYYVFHCCGLGSLSSLPVYELTFHAFVPVRVHERNVCRLRCVCMCALVFYSASLNETVRLHVRL